MNGLGIQFALIKNLWKHAKCGLLYEHVQENHIYIYVHFHWGNLQAQSYTGYKTKVC